MKYLNIYMYFPGISAMGPIVKRYFVIATHELGQSQKSFTY